MKDYSELSVPLVSLEDKTPFGLEFVIGLARDRDNEGKAS